MAVPSLKIPTYKVLNQYFLKHIRSFGEVDSRIKAHFDLKTRHTYNVVRNIQWIARQEKFDEKTIMLSRILALFHDIGRFRQFMDFGTFNDAISLNHAELSVRILYDEDIDRLIPSVEMKAIAGAILQHNLFRITETRNDKVILYSRLLRDADKMDIWKLQSETDIIYAIENHASVDQYEIPDSLYQSFTENHNIRVDLATSINDFRLLRLGWIFDINFPSTFDLLIKRDYATAILSKIPASDRLREITGIIHAYMHQHARK
jgi:hypothetical protein